MAESNNDKKAEKNRLINKETIGFTLIAFDIILMLFSFLGEFIFGELGISVDSFLFGVFGFFDFFALFLLLYCAISLVMEKNPVTIKGFVLFLSLSVVSMFLLVHSIVTAGYDHSSFGAYLAECFKAGENGALGCTPFGLVGSLLVYPVVALATNAGAYIIFAVVFLLFAYLCVASVCAKLGIDLRNVVVGKIFGRGEGKRVETPKPEKTFADLETTRPAEQYVRQQPQPVPEQYNRPVDPYMTAPQPALSPYNIADDLAKQEYEKKKLEMQQKIYGYRPPKTEQSKNNPYEDPASSGAAMEYRNRNLMFDRNSSYNRNLHTSNENTKNTSSATAQPQNYHVETPSAMPTNPYMAKPSVTPTINSTPTYTEYSSRVVDEKRTPDVPTRQVVVEKNDQAMEERRSPYFDPNVYSIPTDRNSSPVENKSEPTWTRPSTPARNETVERPTYNERADFRPIEPPARDIPVEMDRTEESREIPRRDIATDRGSFSAPEEEKTDFAPISDDDQYFDLDKEEEFTDDVTPIEEEEQPEPTSGRDRFRGLFSDNDRFSSRETFNTPSMETKSAVTEEEDDDEVLFDDEEHIFDIEEEEEKPQNDRFSSNVGYTAQNVEENRFTRMPSAPSADITGRGVPVDDPAPIQEEPEHKVPVPPKRVFKDYIAPSVNLLDIVEEESFVSDEEIENNKRCIIDTLASFNITTEVHKVVIGPVFTRYDLKLPNNVTVRTLERYQDNIALALRTQNINLYANYKSGTIAIEAPNQTRSTVRLYSLLDANEYKNKSKGKLIFCVGKDVEGNTLCVDLCETPHMLVAGTTGSGKSVFLHEVIVSLIMKYSPEDLRLILIDPKKSEFTPYERLPHLMVNDIISDVSKAVTTLNWLIEEMERRYLLFQQFKATSTVVRNIKEYNEKVEREEKLPYIVVVMDELADFMSQAKKEMESKISRIAAKSRASGIHLVIATQRPSVDVITGVLKANLPSRFALRVSSEMDSRVILDASGAQYLLGRGDLIFRTSSMLTSERVQAAYITSDEIANICQFIRDNNEAFFDETIATYIENNGKEQNDESDEGGDDGDNSVEPVYIDALRFVVRSGTASISMIQRKCSVGYNKAGKIVEWMEKNGFVSAYDGAKPRKVLLTEDEFTEKFGEL